MSVIYILIPIAILLSALGIYLFFWAVKTDQFEDLEKQGLSILFDDDDNQQSKQAKQSIVVANDSNKSQQSSSEIPSSKTEKPKKNSLTASNSEESNAEVKDGD